jgi:hypothetical protein
MRVLAQTLREQDASSCLQNPQSKICAVGITTEFSDLKHSFKNKYNMFSQIFRRFNQSLLPNVGMCHTSAASNCGMAAN